MIIKPFDKWREDKIAAATKKGEAIDEDEPQEPADIECSACEGEGSTSCDCNCPNCFSEVDCDVCGGSGTIEPDDAGALEKAEGGKATRSEYLKELATDLIALSEWMGKPKMHHMVEAGMAPYFVIKDGSELINQKNGYMILHDPENPRITFVAPERASHPG